LIGRNQPPVFCGNSEVCQRLPPIHAVTFRAEPASLAELQPARQLMRCDRFGRIAG